jgi:hypothetical protein
MAIQRVKQRPFFPSKNLSVLWFWSLRDRKSFLVSGPVSLPTEEVSARHSRPRPAKSPRIRIASHAARTQQGHFVVLAQLPDQRPSAARRPAVLVSPHGYTGRWRGSWLQGQDSQPPLTLHTCAFAEQAPAFKEVHSPPSAVGVTWKARRGGEPMSWILPVSRSANQRYGVRRFVRVDAAMEL